MQSKKHKGTVATTKQGKQLNVLGHSITEMLVTRNTAGNYYMFECVSPPGLGIPLYIQKHGDEIATIVEGEFSVMIGNKRFHALKGDICFFPRHVSHSIQNIGTKAGVTLWTVVPGAIFKNFFNKMSKLTAADLNPVTVDKIFSDHGMKLVKTGGAL